MIYDNIKIAALGGDRRQLYTLLRLAAKGCKISACGLDKAYFGASVPDTVSLKNEPGETLDGASVIILPFPASADGVHINAPLDKEGTLTAFKLQSLLRLGANDALIVGGKLPDTFVEAAQDKGHKAFDLLKIEALEIKNAHITAEAAVSIAMNSLSRTLFGSKIAVTGFGRISKQLARLLSDLGAHVTVAARKDSDLAFAETLGYSTLKIGSNAFPSARTSVYDVIYNTVPERILGRDFLEALDKSTLLFELASAPGGFDISAAQELGVNISWALSLPGKYAPLSAGELIADSIIQIISKEVAAI